MYYYNAPDPPWLNKLYIYLLCFITGLVLVAFLALVLLFDRRGVRRRWLARRRHHHHPDHPPRPVAALNPAQRSDRTNGLTAKWVAVWVLMALVGIIGLLDLSVIIDYKTRGNRWFLINWRTHHIHW